MNGQRALETLLEVNRSASPVSFDWSPRTRVIFGHESIDRLGEIAASMNYKRGLVVSDPGIVAAGHADRGILTLQESGIATMLFDGARENPTTEHVEAGVEVAREFRPDFIVGLGGGSSMDCAKGINFIYSCGGKMADYWGVDRATGDMLPLIGIPTTAGTGSELQSFALITDPVTHVKMACGDRRAACCVAILDPGLTLSQPAAVTALTGIDALSHALETWVTRPRNSVSLMASRQAWELVSRNLSRVMEEPDDLDARARMLLGAAFAGMAIENSMLGAAHALANPLTAEYQVPHGHAVGIMLPHVIRFNAGDFSDWYTELSGTSPGELASFVEGMLRLAGLATTLRDCGIEREAISRLAALACNQWTARFNPREVTMESLTVLYEQAC
jgi:alcohol dehydrogenase